MPDTDLTVAVQGAKIPVRVDSLGRFRADFAEQTFEADSFKQLQEKLVKAGRVKLAELAIPFSVITTNGRGRRNELTIRSGVARGMNVQQRRPLVTFDDGEKDTLSGYSQTTLRKLSDDEVAEWRRLEAAQRESSESYQRWIDERRLDLSAKIKEALDAL